MTKISEIYLIRDIRVNSRKLVRAAERLQKRAYKKILFTFMLLIASLPAWSKPQTVILDLPTMNCAMCPITVKKALTKVEGVSGVEVSYERKEAVVTFDDTKATAASLIQTTTNAGYPASVRE